MITHHNNGQEFLILGMPVEAYNYQINDMFSSNFLQYRTPTSLHYLDIPLPPGQWEIMGLGSELTEGQAGEVVGNLFGMYYFDYVNPNNNRYAPGYTLDAALESLHSLIASHNLTPETALFIKKIK